jgi:hypothetical protein
MNAEQKAKQMLQEKKKYSDFFSVGLESEVFETEKYFYRAVKILHYKEIRLFKNRRLIVTLSQKETKK